MPVNKDSQGELQTGCSAEKMRAMAKGKKKQKELTD